MSSIQKKFNRESVEEIIQYLEIKEKSLIEKIKKTNGESKNAMQIELREVQGRISRGFELLEKNL